MTGEYPNSLQVKSGLPPHKSLTPWRHKSSPLDEEYLYDIGRELEDPMASSDGHKKSLYVARDLYDEVVRLRGRVPYGEAAVKGPFTLRPKKWKLTYKGLRGTYPNHPKFDCQIWTLGAYAIKLEPMAPKGYKVIVTRNRVLFKVFSGASYQKVVKKAKTYAHPYTAF